MQRQLTPRTTPRAALGWILTHDTLLSRRALPGEQEEQGFNLQHIATTKDKGTPQTTVLHHSIYTLTQYVGVISAQNVAIAYDASCNNEPTDPYI